MLNQVTAHVWVCYCDGSHSWLFNGVVSLAVSHERNAPVLQVNSYSEEGTLVDIGAWTVERDGKWRRCGAIAGRYFKGGAVGARRPGETK